MDTSKVDNQKSSEIVGCGQEIEVTVQWGTIKCLHCVEKTDHWMTITIGFKRNEGIIATKELTLIT